MLVDLNELWIKNNDNKYNLVAQMKEEIRIVHDNLDRGRNNHSQFLYCSGGRQGIWLTSQFAKSEGKPVKGIKIKCIITK